MPSAARSFVIVLGPRVDRLPPFVIQMFAPSKVAPDGWGTATVPKTTLSATRILVTVLLSSLPTHIAEPSNASASGAAPTAMLETMIPAGTTGNTVKVWVTG